MARQRCSSLPSIAGFMRLFAAAYMLDRSTADFRDNVLHVGAVASANIQSFFEEVGARGRHTVRCSKRCALFTKVVA